MLSASSETNWFAPQLVMACAANVYHAQEECLRGVLIEVLTQHCNLPIMEVEVFETTFILNFLTYVKICLGLLIL